MEGSVFFANKSQTTAYTVTLCIGADILTTYCTVGDALQAIRLSCKYIYIHIYINRWSNQHTNISTVHAIVIIQWMYIYCHHPTSGKNEMLIFLPSAPLPGRSLHQPGAAALPRVDAPNWRLARLVHFALTDILPIYRYRRCIDYVSVYRSTSPTDTEYPLEHPMQSPKNYRLMSGTVNCTVQ